MSNKEVVTKFLSISAMAIENGQITYLKEYMDTLHLAQLVA